MASLRLLSRSTGLKLSKINDDNKRVVPSAGEHNNNDITSQQNANGKKRKRDESEIANSMQSLDESAIKAIHKKHKIRISDLHALQDGTKSESRKSQKQAARLYPQPLQSFSHLEASGASQALIKNLSEQAYWQPTEVQLATIPLLMAYGDDEPDLLTVAPTGSGKTLAFLIPLIQKVTKLHQSQSSEKHVSSLILAPTRELVGQIVSEGKKLAIGTGVRIAEMRKGMRLHEDATVGSGSTDREGSDERDDSEDETDEEAPVATVVKADVLVSTPLQLVHAITNRNESGVMALPDVSTLVLDEADYLLDPLFRDQVMSIWSACTSSQLRTSLWSATIGSSIEEIAISTIHARNPAESVHHAPLLRTVIGLKDTSLPTISHKLVYASTEPGKLMGLRQLLHPAPPASKMSASSQPLRPPFLIFTQTIPRATALYDELKFDIPAAAGGSKRIAVLHSNLSSTQRAKTMAEFRQGQIWILITTDLLSRGIDFRGINGVVNYDIPTTAASYVHRAGRTGRAGRMGGICVTFYTKEDIKYLRPIANLISSSEKNYSGRPAEDAESGKKDGVPEWLLAALPELSKQNRKELKQRGVDVRRAVKESDDKEERRKKGKNRIGTSSGYARKTQNRKKEMIEGSKRRRRKEMEEDASGDREGGFEGFHD